MTRQGTLLWWKWRSLVFGLVVALSIVATGAGTASASAGSLTPDKFAQQAEAAGLNPAQARSLQARVDAYLEKLDGVQVAANQIRLTGATLTLTLPGEKRVRSLTSGTDSSIMTTCPYYNFCAYKYVGFTGDRINYYYCWVQNMNWATYGSWVNNQTPGTQARLLDAYLIPRTWSTAYSENSNYDWTWIYYIDPC